MRTLLRATAVAAVLMPGTVSPQAVRYEGSASVSSGTYIFDERTTSWSFTNGLALERGPISVRAALPVYLQNTSLISGSAVGPLPSGGPAGQAVADSSRSRGDRRGSGGSPSPVSSWFASVISDPVEAPSSTLTGYELSFGDPTVALSLTTGAGERALLSLSGTAKVPVTDTSQLGTGAWDFGVGTSLSLLSRTGVFLSASGAFWTLGDPPDLELEDVWLGTVSVGMLREGGWSLATSISASTSAVAEFDAPVSLGATASKLGDRGSLGVSATAGLTDTAPDLTVTAFWAIDLRSGR